jgi:lysyl-tRNA synthetase class 1
MFSISIGKSFMSISKDLIQSTKSWPFEEARKILHHVKSVIPEKGYILLETGYGPSGLPHIGTFGGGC